jgi:hypothetical protein
MASKDVVKKNALRIIRLFGMMVKIGTGESFRQNLRGKLHSPKAGGIT